MQTENATKFMRAVAYQLFSAIAQMSELPLSSRCVNEKMTTS